VHIMQRSSGQIVLTCEGCGEKAILLGSEKDWRYSHPVFRCERCGQKLTLDGRTEEEVLSAAP
jgi:DNA-directed RNA polymerase subunit RPC12/RpoP